RRRRPDPALGSAGRRLGALRLFAGRDAPLRRHQSDAAPQGDRALLGPPTLRSGLEAYGSASGDGGASVAGSAAGAGASGCGAASSGGGLSAGGEVVPPTVTTTVPPLAGGLPACGVAPVREGAGGFVPLASPCSTAGAVEPSAGPSAGVAGAAAG